MTDATVTTAADNGADTVWIEHEAFIDRIPREVAMAFL